MPQEHAAYSPKSEQWQYKKNVIETSASRYNDPLIRYQLSYLNGGGGSGKTSMAIELFRVRDPVVLTPTHRLAKEMQNRGVKAQTYRLLSLEWTK